MRISPGPPFLLCLALLGGATPSALRAQSDAGTDFWLTFPRNELTDNLTLVVVLTSETDTVVTSDAPYSSSTPLSAGTATSLVFSAGAMLTTSGSGSGIHLSAPQPFVVTAIERADYSVDSFQVFPQQALGSSYRIMAYPDNGTFGSSAFAVVAVQDGTSVSITPTATAGSLLAGQTTLVMMDRGDAYQVLADGPGADLSGSTILASAPIAVFGANTCAFVPVAAPICDFTVEQLIPTSSFGTEFVAVPSAGRISAPDRLRILAIQDSTALTYDPPAVGVPTSMNAGNVAEFSLTAATHITADRPVYLARFAVTEPAGGPPQPPGDPFQLAVPPIQSFTNRHTVFIDEAETAWLDVVTTSTDCVFLDGSRVYPDAFAQVGSGPFLAARLELVPGKHVLSSNPVSGVTVYGFSGSEGYGTAATGHLATVDCGLFLDGFESGNTSAWSSATP